MRISTAGLQLIQEYEGLRLRAYNDGAGNSTIGWGHLIEPGERFDVISRAEADNLLYSDLAAAESAVNGAGVPLNQSQFDALVSLAFNWGAGNFKQSLLLKLLRDGNYAGAAERLRAWPTTAAGVVMPGLVRRRAAEAELFLSEGGGPPGFPLPASPLRKKPATKKNRSQKLR